VKKTEGPRNIDTIFTAHGGNTDRVPLHGDGRCQAGHLDLSRQDGQAPFDGSVQPQARGHSEHDDREQDQREDLQPAVHRPPFPICH